VSIFGRKWIDMPAYNKRANDDDSTEERQKGEEFPDMSQRQRVTLGKRSGLIILG
jgi:hypothetical protein